MDRESECQLQIAFTIVNKPRGLKNPKNVYVDYKRCSALYTCGKKRAWEHDLVCTNINHEKLHRSAVQPNTLNESSPN